MNYQKIMYIMILFEICSTFLNIKITLLFTLFNHRKKQRNSTVDIGTHSVLIPN